MTYTLDRYPQREDPDAIEALKSAMQLSTWAGSLGRLLDKVNAKEKQTKEAQRVIAKMVMAAQAPAEDGTEDFDLMGKMLGKVVKFIGKKLIKAIVRPILQFAARMTMNIIRIAAQTVLRFVLIPIFEAVTALAIANPVTAAAIAVVALAAGGTYLWKKYLTPVLQEKFPETRADDTSNVAVDATDVETGPQARTENESAVAPEVYQPTVMDKVTQVVKSANVPEFFQTPAVPPQGVTPRPSTRRGVQQARRRGGTPAFTGFGEDVDGYIVEASRLYPILPVDVLRGFIKMEAGWTGAMSPTGAIGTGQFIQPTWDDLAAMPAGRAIGMTRIGSRFRTPQDPRFDKRINTLATGLLASQNAQMLTRAGLPITGENLYMMHNIGPGIIPVMLGRPASSGTLRAMRQNGMTSNMTASQFLAFQKGRFGEAYNIANTSTAVVANQPQMARAVTVEPRARTTAKAAQAAAPKILPQGRPQSTDLVRGPGNSIVRMQ